MAETQAPEAPAPARPRTMEEKSLAHVEEAFDEEKGLAAAEGRKKTFKDIHHKADCPENPMRMEEDTLDVPPDQRENFGGQKTVKRLRCQDCGAEVIELGKRRQVRE